MLWQHRNLAVANHGLGHAPVRYGLWTTSLDDADEHRSMDRVQHNVHDSIDLSHDIQLPVLIS